VIAVCGVPMNSGRGLDITAHPVNGGSNCGPARMATEVKNDRFPLWKNKLENKISSKSPIPAQKWGSPTD
jgi:hypothetical protein